MKTAREKPACTLPAFPGRPKEWASVSIWSQTPINRSSSSRSDLSPRDAERLAVIQEGIREIQNRRDLDPAAKERGIRALKKAKARLLARQSRF